MLISVPIQLRAFAEHTIQQADQVCLHVTASCPILNACSSYKKYTKAYTYLDQNPACKLVLTNADTGIFVGYTQYPGEGALAAPFLSISKETIIVGKPECVEVHEPDRSLIITSRRRMLDVLIDE